MISRKRLNLSVSNDTFRRARALASRCGFRSPSHMAATLLTLMMDRHPAPTDEPHEEDEIEAVFRDLEDLSRDIARRWDINNRQ